MFKINDNIIIFNAFTKKVIAAGVIVTVKDCYLKDGKYYDDVYAVSTDYKYFFNVNSKNLIIKNNLDDEYKVDVKSQDISELSITQWNQINKCNIDVFTENTLADIDYHVITLVNALNLIPDINTTGSCSGHDGKKLWVSFGARSIKSLIFISTVLNKYFIDDFVLSTMRNRSQTSHDALEIAIISNYKGRKAYECANALADRINYELAHV